MRPSQPSENCSVTTKQGASAPNHKGGNTMCLRQYKVTNQNYRPEVEPKTWNAGEAKSTNIGYGCPKCKKSNLALLAVKAQRLNKVIRIEARYQCLKCGEIFSCVEPVSKTTQHFWTEYLSADNLMQIQGSWNGGQSY